MTPKASDSDSDHVDSNAADENNSDHDDSDAADGNSRYRPGGSDTQKEIKR